MAIIQFTRVTTTKAQYQNQHNIDGPGNDQN